MIVVVYLEMLYKPNHSLVLVHVAELPATLNETGTLRHFNFIKYDQSWRIWGREGEVRG